MEHLDDAVHRLRTAPNDRAAWERLFTLMWPYVLALGYRLLPDSHGPSDAEDLAQQVFVRLAQALHAGRVKIRDAAALRALLAVMTRRLAIDEIRRRNRLLRSAGHEYLANKAGEVADEYCDLSEVDWHDLLERVSGKLSSEDRLVLELRLQGYELREIADRLCVSTRTVERKLLRIRDLIQPYLVID